MAIVTSYDWTSDTWTHHNGDNPARKAFREAVETVAAHAREKLPETVNGRIEAACKIVIQGDVELLPEDKAKVGSQTHGTTTYHLVDGTCDCRDFEKAPDGWCKHRIAYGIYKRAIALAKQKLETQAESPRQEPMSPEPTSPVETPATAHIPAQFLTEIHGKMFIKYEGLLTLAHERGLVTLSAHFILRCGKVILSFEPCANVRQANGVIALVQKLVAARENAQNSGSQRFQNRLRHRQ